MTAETAEAVSARTSEALKRARDERDEAREEYLKATRQRATTAVRGEAWRSFQEAEARYQARKRKAGL